MSPDDGALPTLVATAGMDACRLYSIAAVSFLIPDRSPVPFLQASLALLFALLITRGIRRIKRHRITELLINFIAYGAVLFWTLKSYSSLPFVTVRNPAGFQEALTSIDTGVDWFTFSLIILWTGIYWIRGVHLGATKATFTVTAGRFDAGVRTLFFVYFIRMGLQLDDPKTSSLIAAYFVFSILALFLARNLRRDKKFTGIRSTASLLLPFSAGFLFLGLALVLVYPYLTGTAGTIYQVIHNGAAPLKPALVSLLRFLLSFSFARPPATAAVTDAGGNSAAALPGEESFWMRLFERVLSWGLIGLIGILSSLLILYMLWRLTKYLLSRTGPADTELTFKMKLVELIRYVRTLFRHWYGNIKKFFVQVFRRPRNEGAGIAGFRYLCSWGRKSGLPRDPAETPGEYGERLAVQFPALRTVFEKIIRAGEKEFYGRYTGALQEAAELRNAKRILGRFSLIPSRIACKLRLKKKV